MGTATSDIDQVLARFLGEVVRDIAHVLSDADRVTAWLGYTDDDSAIERFLAAHAEDVADLSTLAQDLLDGDGVSGLAALEAAGAAWHTLQDLLDAGPSLRVGADAAAVNVLSRLAGVVMDRQLQRHAPVAWALARVAGITGDGAVPHQAVAGLLADPAGQIWRTFRSRPSWQHLGLHWTRRGGRATSVMGGRLPDALASAAAALALDPTADTVVRQTELQFHHVPSGLRITVEAAVLASSATGEFRGVVLHVAPPLAPDITLSERLHLQFDGGLADGFGAFVGADGTIRPMLPAGARLPTVRLVTIDEPDALPGLPDRNRPVLDAWVGPEGWSVRLGVADLDVALSPEEAGPVVRAILPDDGVRLVGSFAATVSPAGLALEGGAAPALEQKADAAFVLRDTRLVLERAGGAIEVNATTTATLVIGPAALTAEGLGARLSFAPADTGRGNAGPLQVTRELVRPTGIGFGIDTALIRGGGFLARDPATDEYDGAVELAVRLGATELAITGFASIGTVGNRPSVIALMAAEFIPGIPLAFGFSVTGVGGIVGINRGLDLAALRSGLAEGGVEHLLFPRDVVESAPEVFPLLRSTFPPQVGRHVIGPMVQIGWGLPVPVARASVAVLVPIPRPQRIELLGRLTVDLPLPERPLIHLDAQIVGSVDLTTGAVVIDAGLVDSFLGPYRVSGDLALRSGRDGFVLAVGGVHPRFTPPRPLPALRRVTLDLSQGDSFQLTVESYLAIAPGSIQFGALAQLHAVLGSLSAEGRLGFDALIRTHPQFAFEVDVLGHLLVKHDGDPLCTADANVRLEGPGRWRAAGTVTVRVLGLELSGEFDRSWGTTAVGPPPTMVDVAALVRAALGDDRTWRPRPPRSAGGVRLGSAAGVGLHPRGSLVLTQGIAPAGVKLDRFGPSAVSGPATLPVAATVTGASTTITPVVTTERFVNGDFFDLTDDQRLTAPAIVEHPSGLAIGSEQWQTGASVAHEGHTVLAWARQGIVPKAANGALRVRLDVAGGVAAARDVTVLGPGAVTGIDASAITRFTPRDGAAEVPFDELAVVEFVRPDLPWAFSPAASGRQSPHPWLMAVAVKVSDGVNPLGVGATGGGVLRTTGARLPDPAEASLWAHVHVDGPVADATSLNRAGTARSRLLCPTVLEPGAEYVVCVVPVFARGRDAGLGLTADIGAAADPPFAWNPGDETVELPVYAAARFRTASTPVPTFAELVGRLRPHPAPASLGSLVVSVEGVDVAMSTVVRSPALTVPDDVAGRAAVVAALDRAARSGHAAPRYGAALVDASMGAPPPRWMDEVNHHPSRRVAAGLGAAIVRAQQDRYVELLWRELADLDGARTRTLRRQYAALASSAAIRRWVRPPAAAGRPAASTRAAQARTPTSIVSLSPRTRFVHVRREHNVQQRVTIALDRPRRPVPTTPVAPAVAIEDAAVGHLLSMAPQWLLPGGADGLADDTATALTVDRGFVAAVLIGMNEAIADEARWRRIPVAPRTLVFRRFWGRPGGAADLATVPSSATASLASLVSAAGDPVVVALRGEAVRRVPTMLVSVGAAAPAFHAMLGADVLLVGFDILRASDTITFRERVTSPRFGSSGGGGRPANGAVNAVRRWRPIAAATIPASALLTAPGGTT